MTREELAAWSAMHERICMAARKIAELDTSHKIDIEPWPDENMFCIVFTDIADQDTITYFIDHDQIVEAWV